MKNIKKLVVVAVMLMAVLTAVALNTMDTLAVMAEDGFAVPADSGLSRLLSSGDGSVVSLVGVGYEDVVYSSLNGYYVGEDRSSIDRSFPIYINSGTGLRFLDEEIWLVSAEIDLMRTYEGLYLTEGYTYNRDLSQADEEEFVFLALQNKLFMNAQAAVFENRITTHDIPSNSILAMSDSAIRWYYLDNNALVYAEEESVFDAKLTIGSHTYDYVRLLKALDLLEEAIHRAENHLPIDDQTQEIDEILNGGGGSQRDPTQGEVRPGEAAEGVAPGGPGAPGGAAAGGEQNTEEDGQGEENAQGPDGEDPDASQTGQDGEEEPGAGSDADPAGTGGNTSQAGQGGASDPGGSENGGKPGDPSAPNGGSPGASDGSAGGSEAGSGSADGSGGSAGSGDSGSGAGGSGGASGGQDGAGGGQGSNQGTGNTPGEGSGSGGGSNQGQGDNQGSGGAGGDPGSGDTTGDEEGGEEGDQSGGPGGTPEDGSGEGGERNPNPNPAGTPNPNPDAKPKPRVPPVYKDPVVTLENLEAWSYALGGMLKIDDSYGAIQKGVKVGIYRRLSKDPGEPKEVIKDNKGNSVNVYASGEYEGKSTIVRKTFVGSQPIALSPIEPGTKIYVQFYYRYTEETNRETDPETGALKMTFARHTYYSDFYELTTQTVEGGDVQDILANWEAVFAGHDTSMELRDFTITNSTDYDPEMLAQDVDFDTFFTNFKKDTLPYLYRMEYTMTPRDENGNLVKANAVTIMAGSSVMNKAKLPGGTTFTSTNPKLKSNSNYKVTAVAKDRYNNEIPLRIGTADNSADYTDWESTIFTQKASPTVKIEEVENVTDKLSLKITVSDPDGALTIGENGEPLPLKLSVTGANGEAAAIFGNWLSGGKKGDSFGDETTDFLELLEPEDGKTYEFDLLSLAFAQLYYVRVNSDYDPQPTAYGADSAGEPLARKEGQILGNMRSYTASLTDGSVSFTSRVTNLLDTYGTMEFTMNERSTVSALPLVDEFHFFLTQKEDSKEVAHITLKMSELDVEDSDQYQYDPETKSVLLLNKGPNGPIVRLTGTEDQYDKAGRNPWQAMLIKSYINEESGETVYIPPMTLSIEMPAGTLKNSTRHVMKMESRVIKSGVYYQIPTSLTLTEFITRKLQPKLEYELFIAGDVLTYLKLRIDDPDKTIRSENGRVYMDLYFKNSPDDEKGTRLQRKYVDANGPEKGEEVRFTGLIPGAYYYVKFETQSYNDGEGFTNQEFNYELWRHNIIGGSFLTGDINLVGLDYHARGASAEEFYAISGAEITAELERTRADFPTIGNQGYNTLQNVATQYNNYWLPATGDCYATPMMKLPEEATFLTLDDYHTASGSVYVYFFKETKDTAGRYQVATQLYSGSRTSTSAYYTPSTSSGQRLVFAVPEEAKYVRFAIPGQSYAETNGLRVGYYTTPWKGKNILANADDSYRRLGKYVTSDATNLLPSGNYDTLYQYPVKPGQMYVTDINNGSTPAQKIQLYSKDRGYMGCLEGMYCTAFVVPRDVHYISLTYTRNKPNDRFLFLVSDADEEEGYDATVDVSVEDTQGYLYNAAKDKDYPTVDLTLRCSPSIEHPSFVDNEGKLVKPLLTQKVKLAPADPEVRKDRSAWEGYTGSWVPFDENDPENCSGTLQQLLARLTPNARWQLTLSVEYNTGEEEDDISEVVLDTIEFQTDGAYDTIRNNEEMRKILRNPYGNYLVVADFEHYLNLGAHITVNGSVDFQGHVITRRAGASFGNYPYLIYSINGSVRNLVYDYPAVEDEKGYTNPGAVVYSVNLTGLLENVIVRTQSTVHVTTESNSILCRDNSGTIRNFVVKLGGDLRIHSSGHYLGGIFRYNAGTIEDGYVYAGADHGVIMYPNASWNGVPYYGGLICYNYYSGIIRNVYTVHDTWYARPSVGTNSYAMVGGYYATGTLQDSYHVGEYYVYTGYLDQLDKTRSNFYPANLQVTHAVNQEMNRDVSYFTDTPYQNHISSPRYVYQKPVKGLRDAQWQADTLGDAFDAEGCIPMGFYPRLKTLPTIMQKYQEYIPLPTTSQGVVPEPISDDWASEKEYGVHGNESGYIRMVFRNDSEYQIETLSATVTSGKTTVDTLKLDVARQGRTSEGLWEVILRAEPVDYLSYYTINGMTYKVGNATITTTLNYKTENIEFWKEVRDAEGWRQINAHMSWNYRIMQDIDFTKVTNQGYMTINGNVNNTTTATGFSGRIDGQFKKLSNMNLSNIAQPYVFYNLNNGGALENLVFDKLTITATAGAGNMTGLVRAGAGGTIRNVHIRNSLIRGIGYVGGILAYQSTDIGHGLEGCSVADSRIEDGGGGYVLYLGGLVGYSHGRDNIRSSYVRNVTITADKSSVVSSVGGIIGYSNTTGMTDCYATGTITAKAMYVGGIVGYQNYGECRVWNSWTNMWINSSYPNGAVGGIAGYARETSNGRCMVVGDILSASAASTNRVVGNSNAVTYMLGKTFYAYAKQSINNDDKADVRQARQLFTATQLRDWAVWSETIKLGRYWNYTPVNQGAYPKVCLPDGSEVWGQTDIPLPDVNAYELQVTSATYNQTNSWPMQVTLNIKHPGLDLSELEKLTDAEKNEAMAEYFTLAFDGIDLEQVGQIDEATKLPKMVITWYPGKEESGLEIKNMDDARTKALDLYPLTVTAVKAGKTELRVQVKYLNLDGTDHIFYWDIPSIDKWNEFMDPKQRNKGYTNENFRIIGMIDFGAGSATGTDTTEFVGLSLGRLEGPKEYGWEAGTSETGGIIYSVRDTIGFKNLRYTAGASGTPWIETVGHGLERLHFDNMGFYYPNTSVTRERTGGITLCFGMKDLILTDMHLETNVTSNRYFGFVSKCEGPMERVNVNGLDMKRVGGNRGRTEYAGGVAALVTGSFTELEGRNITVDMPYCNNVGGMVGTASDQTEANKNTHILTGTFEDIEVIGCHVTGGVFGNSGRRNISGITVRRATVTTTVRYAGAFAGGTAPYNYQEDILISGCNVYDKRDEYANLVSEWWSQSWQDRDDYGAGGYAGYVEYGSANPVRRIRVENTTVESCDYAGGIAAYFLTNLRDAEIYNCDIRSVYNPTYNTGNYRTLPRDMAAGGVCAVQLGWSNRTLAGVVVRDTRITGRSYVGGIVGRSQWSNYAWITNSYVADDVEIKANGYTVTSRVNEKNETEYIYTENSCVGGMVGTAQGLQISNSICGASVSGPGSCVGGLVGQIWYSSYPAYDRYIKNSIYAGEEVRGGKGYVGGIIGRFDSADAQLKEGAISNVIVCTNVKGGNGKDSLWINDMATVVDTNQDSPSVYIWEYSTLNGQLAKDIVTAADTAEIPSLAAKPESSELIQAAELYKQEFYTSKGFTATNWYMDNLDEEDNQFFPYSALSGALLELSRWADADVTDKEWTADGKTAVGIKLPPKEAETTPAATVVYATGIDTLNIETGEPNSAVTLCGQSLTTDENGVASMTWNFKTPLGGSYTETVDSLRRDTLVNGSWWYFIDKWGDGNSGKLRAGVFDLKTSSTDKVATETEFVKTADGNELTGVIHLWGTQALTEDGTIYDLAKLQATESGKIGSLAQKDSQPFLSFRHGNKKTQVDVYHNFSIYGGTKVPDLRLYQLDNKLYPLSAYRDYVYDGVLLMTAGTGIAKENYFAVLNKDGDLTSYLSAISREKWTSSGIKQMSNNFNPDDVDPMESNVPIVVLRYTNGRVCVVHFGIDRLLYDSGQATGLVSYASKYLTGLFRPSAEENIVPQDPTYRAALEEAEKYRDPEADPAYGLEVDNSASADGTGDAEPTGDGTGGGEGMDGQEAPGVENDPPVEGNVPGEGGEAGEPGESGEDNVPGGPAEAGQPGADGPGEGNGPAEGAYGDEPGADGPSVEDGTNQVSGTGGPAGPGGDLPGEDGQTVASGSGQADGSAGTAGSAAGGEALPDTLYIQADEGKVYKATASGSLEVVPCGGVSRDEESGTYSVEGKTYYADQAAQPPKGMPGAVTLVSEELHTKQVLAELGAAMVAYDPVTGQYSPYVTETLLGDAPRKTTDPIPGKNLGGQDEAAVPGDAGNSSFEVGHGLGRDLTPREQSGFVLLTLAAVAAFGILGVIFAREKRRRH